MIFKRSAVLTVLAALAMTSTNVVADTPKRVGEDAAQAYAAYAPPTDQVPKQFGSPCFIGVVPEKFEEVNEADCMPQAGAKKTAIIWGDSSMAMYAGDLKSKFARAGYSMGQLTSSLCPPITNFQLAVRPYCEKYNDRFFDLIKRVKPSIVVMSWFPNGPYTVMPDQLASTLNTIQKLGCKVVVLGSNPLFYTTVLQILAGRARSNDPSVSIDANQNPKFKFVQDIEKLIRQTIATRATGVRYVSVLTTVCPNQTCVLAVNGTPLYSDDGHVTPLGSALNTDRFFPLLLK